MSCRRLAWSTCLLLLASAGCRDESTTGDVHTEAVEDVLDEEIAVEVVDDPLDDPDAFDATDDEEDAADIVSEDAPEDGASHPTMPAEVLRTGTSGLLLTGIVLTPTGVLDPGDVLIAPDGTIACVDADCSSAAGAGDATWIDTHGILSPGLIDAHNHVAYNFLPEWVPDPPRLFENRYQWAADPDYEAHIEPYAAHRSTGTHYCPAAKWGELRSLVHGTTTIQGQSFQQSCVNWGVRNADHFHNLIGYDHMRTAIGSVRDITDADAANYIASFDDTTAPITRFAVHMAEGYTGDHVDEEFDSFAGRDTRTNRHAGTSLLHNGTSLLIHCVPLTEAQLVEVHDTDSKIAWSPSSNMVLYGRTAPIQRILQLGIPTAIAPDWTPSGEDEMLSEMRFGLQYGIDNTIPELTTQKIWGMSTSDAAVVVGLEDHIGTIEVGMTADIAVFGRDALDPYQAVIDSRAEDVRLVLIGGIGMYGDANIQAETQWNDYCEAFDACGAAKYICVQESPTAASRRDETLDDIRTQLYNILEGIGYPVEEQYGRGDELLPLVDCS
ncbi:MAG: amidohydrolase family protein [Deltaproteobacteria bacterium]|nr:amidohydrolase family protein [Deltaproteobacteria bacterium]